MQLRVGEVQSWRPAEALAGVPTRHLHALVNNKLFFISITFLNTFNYKFYDSTVEIIATKNLIKLSLSFRRWGLKNRPLGIRSYEKRFL